MSKKVAKLVTMTFTTRILVEEGLTEDQEIDAIADEVRQRVSNQLFNDGIGDHITEIEPDEECPAGALLGDFYPENK